MIIGVTGGIASGKSEVCRILESLGFVKIDADVIAHDVLKNSEIVKEVVARFGEQVLKDDDQLLIDRKKLGKIVFSDNNKMNILESITHPQITKQIESIISNNKEKNFVIEAIELVSSGLIDLCDQLWVVHVDQEQQLKRLIENRGMSLEDAMSRIKMQENHDWSESDADRIIYSTEPIETMVKQVKDALEISD